MEGLKPITRKEALLDNIAGGTNDITPVTREEQFLAAMAGNGEAPEPITRLEYFMAKAAEAGGGMVLNASNPANRGQVLEFYPEKKPSFFAGYPVTSVATGSDFIGVIYQDSETALAIGIPASGNGTRTTYAELSWDDENATLTITLPEGYYFASGGWNYYYV